MGGIRRRRRHRHRQGDHYAMKYDSHRQIVLVGNPNVGKSALFGALTGKYVDVSNYPGTSVEVTRGEMRIDSETFILIDSPGVNSLVPRSEDEQVTLNIVTGSDVYGIVQVVDAKNLKRGLLITYQLVEMGLPLVVCLNIYDEAVERGIEINTDALRKSFGVEFIPTVAVSGQGVPELRVALKEMQVSHHKVRFHREIEESIEKISDKIETNRLNPRGLALNIIASGGAAVNVIKGKEDGFNEFVRKEISALNRQLPHTPGYEIQSTIINRVENQSHRFIKSHRKKLHPLKEKLGFLTMHRWYGLPFILLILFILYELVGVFGAGVCVDFIENQIFGGVEVVDGEDNFFGIINPIFIRVLSPLGHTGLWGFINDMLVGEYGVITIGLTYSIAIVFPLVTLFFIFFGLLEDSGYLPRLTVMSNKLFHHIGLNGRAILPMVLGLGCDTMATFTTRILETKKERHIATLLLALCIPCSAQLGVVLGMMSAVSFGLLLVVVFTVASQLFIVGYGASKVIPGKTPALIIEIPPLRIPKLKNIFYKTYFKVKLFMREAVPLFILGTLILFLLDRMQMLEVLERITSPIISGVLNLPAESTHAFIGGFLRRDYGVAGLFLLAEKGMLDNIQITVGVTVMVLFVPCLANFFVMIKERGMKAAALMSLFIVVYSVLIGGLLNVVLRFVMKI